MYDIHRFHPEAWIYFENHKNNYIYDCVINNLKKGQESGVYRKDVDSEIITKVYVARFDILLIISESTSFLRLLLKFM